MYSSWLIDLNSEVISNVYNEEEKYMDDHNNSQDIGERIMLYFHGNAEDLFANLHFL